MVRASFILGSVIMIILTIFLWSRGPIVAFKPWYDWFDKYDPQKQYRRCLSPTIMAYFYGPPIFFDIAKLFITQNEVPHTWYIDFIMSVMRSFGRDIIPGSKDSILVPRNICESLAPDENDPPEALAMRKAMRLRKGTSVNVGGTSIRMPDDGFGKWPVSVDGWRALMCADKGLGGWGCNYSTDKWGEDNDAWGYEGVGATNFLWKFYGIPYNSALVKGFVTQSKSFSGLTDLYPDAMKPLLGINDDQDVGGWYGLLRGGDRWGGYNSLMVQSYVWADALDLKAPATSPCSSPVNYLVSGLSMGLAVAPLFGPEKEAVITGEMIARATGAFAAGSLAGGLLGAASQGCFGK